MRSMYSIVVGQAVGSGLICNTIALRICLRRKLVFHFACDLSIYSEKTGYIFHLLLPWIYHQSHTIRISFGIPTSSPLVKWWVGPPVSHHWASSPSVTGRKLHKLFQHVDLEFAPLQGLLDKEMYVCSSLDVNQRYDILLIYLKISQ